MPGRWRTLGRELRTPHRIAAALLARYGAHHMMTLAAGLAFYFLFAFFPFLLFLVSVVSLVPHAAGLMDWLLANASAYVPAAAWGLVEGGIRSVLGTPRGGLVSLGALLALWSASYGFSGVMDCLNVAYGVVERRPFWRTSLEAAALTVALSFFMIVAFVLTLFAGPIAALVAGALGPAGGFATVALNWILSLALVTLVTATIYYVCPDVDGVPWQWFSPGVVLFTLGFGAASAAFSVYVARFGTFDRTYGTLGAPIVLLFWLYLLATFLLLGGELNALLDERRGAGPVAAG